MIERRETTEELSTELTEPRGNRKSTARVSCENVIASLASGRLDPLAIGEEGVAFRQR
jgi:hypothetical protein